MSADPFKALRDRQLQYQAQPVVLVDPATGEAGAIRLSGSNAEDLEPVNVAAQPTFSPYGYPFLTTDGVLQVVTAAGNTRTYPAGTFPLGVILPVRITQVLNGTTASLYVATPST